VLGRALDAAAERHDAALGVHRQVAGLDVAIGEELRVDLGRDPAVGQGNLRVRR
jgi:hypothetical protein